MCGFVFTDLRHLHPLLIKFFILCALCLQTCTHLIPLRFYFYFLLFHAGFVFTDLRTLLFWLCSLFLFILCALCVYELARACTSLLIYFYFISCAAGVSTDLRTLDSSSDISCTALCLRTCAHSSSDYFHYFILFHARLLCLRIARAWHFSSDYIFLYLFINFMRGFVFTDFRTLALLFW